MPQISTKKLLKNTKLWGVVVAAALLILSFRGLKWVDMVALCGRINYLYLFPILGLGVLMVVSRAIRWQAFIRGAKHIPAVRVIPLYSAGQALNIIMPALTGQVGRVILFSRRERLKKTVVFSTFLLEVFFDAIALFLFMGLTSVAFAFPDELGLTSVAFAFPDEYRSASYILGAVCIGAILVLYGYLAFKEPIGRLGRRHIRGRWRGFYITVKKFSRSFTTGVTALKSSSHMMQSLFLSILGWVAHGGMVYFLFKAFGFELPFAASFVILVINSLALMIPLTPGNAGTFEFVVIGALSWFGIGKTEAALYSVALHILDILPVFLLAALYMRSHRLSLKQLQLESAENGAQNSIEKPALVGAGEGR